MTKPTLTRHESASPPTEQREEHIAAFFAKQLPTHGWSTGTLSVHPQWKRPDGQPLDVTRSDGYATAFAVYALSAVGVLPLPKKVTQEKFDTAYATAEKLIAPGVMKPNSTGKQARDATMTMSEAKPATPVSAKAPSASADKPYTEAKPPAAITEPNSAKTSSPLSGPKPVKVEKMELHLK